MLTILDAIRDPELLCRWFRTGRRGVKPEDLHPPFHEKMPRRIQADQELNHASGELLNLGGLCIPTCPFGRVANV